jgi:hypothetical protein
LSYYEAVAQGVIVIVAVVATEAAPAAVDCALIVPATATAEPVRPVRAKTVVAVVLITNVSVAADTTEYVPFTEASTLVNVTLLPAT